MKRCAPSVLSSVLVLGVALLTACSGNGPSHLKVHEVSLSGGVQENIVWVYGTLGTSGSSSIKLGESAAELRPQVQDALATPGSLSINGRATYRVPTTPGAPKLSLTRSSDGTFAVAPLNGASVAAIYYTDGVNWSKLSGVSGIVGANGVSGLRGAGQLTDAEADVLGGQLIAQAPLAVAVLNDSAPGLSTEPAASETLHSSLYILPAAPLSATTGTVSMTSANAPSPVSGDPVNFNELASGNNAAGADPQVQVATTAADARNLYARAYGRQTPGVAAPALTANQTLVGIFIGQRSTGGYGVKVSSAEVQGGLLTLTVQVSAPKPGSITSMALTSPWTIVSVPGQFSQVKVVDASGQLTF